MLGRYVNRLNLTQGDALMVVDLQNDFLPTGALPVPASDGIVPVVNRYLEIFRSQSRPIIATRDWHPENHCSFKTHGGKWAVHCVQETAGAQFATGLNIPTNVLVISKGSDVDKEAYSAFIDTGLAEQFRQLDIGRLFVCGVATDLCVIETVRHAIAAGFDVVLLGDAIKPVELSAGRIAVREMLELGADIYEPPKLETVPAESSSLLIDLYQLTMLQAYHQHGIKQEAVFEFFVRKLPPQRNFLIAAGLEQALDFLEGLRFTAEEIDWLGNSGHFREEFIDYLGNMRFEGDVHAMPEGTIFFPNEPIFRVTAPLPQAQLVESRLINLLHLQTTIASKAVRCRIAAPENLLVDFGMRRAHGAEAAILAARACFIAGFDGTATVLAGMKYDIPVYGTMAHSFVQAHDDESESLENFATANPDNVVLLIDTYDTEAATEKAVEVARRLKSKGIQVRGVRLDSGDLTEHARRVRRILDNGGLQNTTIFASGNLDEYELRAMVESAAPIDGFGVGTRVIVSSDAPYLDCAYKLQEYAGKPRRKLSEGKATWPGRKQVYRRFEDGLIVGDKVTLENDSVPGEPLVELMMRRGRRLEPRTETVDLRRRVAENLNELPKEFLSLDPADPYRVEISEAIRNMAMAIDSQRATTSKSLAR